MGDKVKVQELDPQSTSLLHRHFYQKSKYGRFGDAGYCLLMSYKEDADNYRNMVARPDDVWVATFPRSVLWCPFFPHIKEAWALRHHPNLMFIFYEDMKKDLPATVKRMADFLGKETTDEKIMKLCEHVDIKNFRKNKSVNPPWMAKIGNPNNEGFIRNGKTGTWREQFDEEMVAQAQRWMRENLAGSDLRFPDV